MEDIDLNSDGGEESDAFSTGCCLSLMVLYTCFRMACSPFTRCLCGAD